MADYQYILMKDVYGEKTPGKIMSVIAGSKPVQVLRGELLGPLYSRQRVQRSDGRPPHNYYTTRDPSVTLYGVETDISPIIGGDLQLLEAIEKPWDRFSVFSEDNKLEWGGRLKIGDQVYVRLPGDTTSAPTWSAGVVRHAGPVAPLPGRNFGVEIKDSRCLGKGSSDGFFGGYSYFECDQDCGLFVSLDKLATKPPHQMPHSAIHKQPKNFTAASLQADPNAHTVVNPPAQGSSVDKHPCFKINDRVVVYNKKNVPMHGIVRWTGMNVQTKTLDTNHIGIETDWAAATTLFPKALTGITHLFKTTPGQRLVLPEHLVFREELANTRTPPARDVDLSDPAAAAREEGLSKRQFMAEQERALKDAEEAKRKEAKKKEKARKAVEEKARKAAEEKAAEGKTKKAAEEKARKENRGNTSNPELREVKGALELDESINLSAQKEALKVFEKAKKKKQDLAEQGIENQIQKQHSWHPGSDPTYETIPGDRIRPNPVPRHNRQNEGATANIPVEHEMAHQQQGGPGGYPPTYSQSPQDQDPHRNIGQAKRQLREFQNMAPEELDMNDGELAEANRRHGAERQLREAQQMAQKELAMKNHELAEAKRREADLSAQNTALRRELEGKTKELAAHNTEVWRIPTNRVNIGREIGKGGWGEVLEGAVSVAVKRLHKEIAYPIHIEKMEREMKLLAEVRHPNLVQFIGAVFDERNNKSPPTLITELLDINLRQAYERNQLNPGNRLSIFVDIALALNYLHQRYDPIIHRDVSAPNVLLQRMPNHQWKGKVSDLGSANFLQHAHTSGEGCILYSAPEVIPRAYNPRGELIPQTTKIDVYSYGVLLCEVVTSTFPAVKNYWSMLKEVEKDYPQFHDLIANCTQESPDNRPTMAQVLNMLEDDKMPKI